MYVVSSDDKNIKKIIDHIKDNDKTPLMSIL